MVAIRKGKADEAEQLAELILQSAPTLLPFLFKGKTEALKFLALAGAEPNGQYSASQHLVLTDNDELMACVTLWASELSKAFHDYTLKSLSAFLEAEQIAHIFAVNPQLEQVFKAPKPSELCVGHFSVSQSHQRNGIGKTLMRHVVSEARRLGKQTVILDVDAANKSAINFYLNCGFVVEHQSRLAPTSQVFLRMFYKL